MKGNGIIFEKNAVQLALGGLERAYQRRVEHLAEELRPQFEAGKLHGYRMHEEWEPELVDARGADPIHRLTCRVERELVPDARIAYVVLACSPSEERDIDGGMELASARWAAAECIVVDAFRVARERGWWRPRGGEYIGHSEWERLTKRHGRRAA